MPSFRNETSILPKKLVCPVSRDFAHIFSLPIFLLLHYISLIKNQLVCSSHNGDIQFFIGKPTFHKRLNMKYKCLNKNSSAPVRMSSNKIRNLSA
jgi:hypothetical protein